MKISNVNEENLDHRNITTLTCIGQVTVQSLGCIQLDLRVERIIVAYKFNAIAGDFPITCDGIIGMDFLKEFNCKLDFMNDKDWLVLRPQGFPQRIEIPIRNAYEDNSIMIPSRSQEVRKVYLTTKQEELLVPNLEIQPVVFISNTMVQGNNAYITILNTNSCVMVIKADNIVTDDIT